MFILGYSGLDGAQEFRTREISLMTPQEARIFQGMDSAAALLKNGKVVAAIQEERLTGVKQTHRFPLSAIRFCLHEGGIGLDDVTFITHGFNYAPWRSVHNRSTFSRRRYDSVYAPEHQKHLLTTHLGLRDVETKFVPVLHHHAHAASAFYQCNFEKALVVVMDGLGEFYGTSIFVGHNNQLEVVKQYDLFSSLGLFYSVVTMHLGFLPNSDEYKVMGLAPYGDPRRFLPAMRRCIEMAPGGRVLVPMLGLNDTFETKETYRNTRQWFEANFCPARQPSEEMTQTHKDLAAAAQHVLNEAGSHIVRHWVAQTGMKNLCLAGGVGLNCVMNGHLLRSGLIERMYVQPAAGDEGTSIGSALYHYYCVHPKAKRKKQILPLYGYAASRTEVIEALQRNSRDLQWECLPTKSLLKRTADLLAHGHVVGWFQGRSEFGPRALGNRSILADPRTRQMVDTINRLVKHRESFRPFAPAVKQERAHMYFDMAPDQELPHMLFTVPMRDQYRARLPAVVHVDGSSRVQTVNKKQHPRFWKLLDAFEHQTGVPILLNTSFNVMGQPIVSTAEDAVSTFLSTNITVLIIDNFLVRRQDGRPGPTTSGYGF